MSLGARNEEQLSEQQCVAVLGGAIMATLCFVKRWRARQIVRTVAGTREMYHSDLMYLPAVNDVFVTLRRWAPMEAARALVRWGKEDKLWEELFSDAACPPDLQESE